MVKQLSKKEIVKGLKQSPFWVFMTHEERLETIEDFENSRVSLHTEEAVRLGSLADYL